MVVKPGCCEAVCLAIDENEGHLVLIIIAEKICAKLHFEFAIYGNELGVRLVQPAHSPAAPVSVEEEGRPNVVGQRGAPNRVAQLCREVLEAVESSRHCKDCSISPQEGLGCAPI